MKFIDASCPYCGAPVVMDNMGRGLCEYCGQWVIYDNSSDKYVLEDAYKTGYEFEKGRQRAHAEERLRSSQYDNTSSQSSQGGAAPARRRLWGWWIVGWIFIFPIPLTVVMVRNKSLPWWGKLIIIIAGWALYFLIAYAYRK